MLQQDLEDQVWERLVYAVRSMCRFMCRGSLWCHHFSLAKQGLTWNQIALTILLRTNRGRTQRALKTEVRMNSNQDHTLPWREGSPAAKTPYWLTGSYQVWEAGPHSVTQIHTNNFCRESLQQWDKHPVKEKQTELQRKWNATVTFQSMLPDPVLCSNFQKHKRHWNPER